MRSHGRCDAPSAALARAICARRLALAFTISIFAPSSASAVCGEAQDAVSSVSSSSASSGASITATDALAILQAAVGIVECAFCVCDVDNSASVSATDALAVIRAAVGQPVSLVCPACVPAEGFPTGTVSGFLFRTSGVQSAVVAQRNLAAGPFLIAPTSDPPAGTTPVAGAVVALEGAPSGTTTGGDGGFSLPVPAGQRRLRIAEGGDDERIPLTVVADTALVLGSAQMSRDEAVAILVDEVVSTLAEPDAAFIVGSQQPLPAGTRLATEDPVAGGAPGEIVLTAPAWLFFVDEYVAATFGHPVLHVLVSDTDGAVTVLDRSYWPRPNDVDLWASVEARLGDDTVQEPTVRLGPPLGGQSIARDAPHLPRHAIPGCNASNSQTFLIVVRGTDESIFLEAAAKMEQALQPAAVYSVVPLPNADFRALMKAAIATLDPQMDLCDTLVVYVTSHGGWDEETDEASGNIMYKRTDVALGAAQTQWNAGSDILLPLRRMTPCHLLVIVDACYSGAMLDPKIGGNFVKSAAILPPAVHAVFLTSTDSETAAEYAPIALGNELFGVATGGLFSNQLIASGLLTSPLDLDNIGNNFEAIVADVPDEPANDQGAKKHVRPPKDGAVCGQTGCATEVEPNDGCTEGTPIDVDPTENAGCATGTIEPGTPGDLDHFRATLPAGSYRVETDAGQDVFVDTGSGSPTSGPSPQEFALAQPTDVCLGVFGAAGEYALLLTQNPPAVCGDGTTDPGESCDGDDTLGCLGGACLEDCSCANACSGSCGGGDVCLFERCVEPCDATTDCPAGDLCSIPGDVGGELQPGCQPPYAPGEAVGTPCDGAGDCESLLCNAFLRECTQFCPLEPGGNAACPGGFCVEFFLADGRGLCGTSCSRDADCGDGYVCRLARDSEQNLYRPACFARDEARNDLGEPCTANATCNSSNCMTPPAVQGECVSNGDCGGGEYCTPFRRCALPVCTAHCATNVDCTGPLPECVALDIPTPDGLSEQDLNVCAP